jgi:hypothetical protein
MTDWLTGGCHCGAVRFRVRRPPETATLLDCNCLICVKKGNRHLIVGEDDFELLSGRDVLNVYTFGARVPQHYFCTVCGIHAFYRPQAPPDRTQWDVNVRCLDLDDRGETALGHLEVEALDGQKIEDTVIALLKAEFPETESLERKYMAVCEEGIFNTSLQTARLDVTPEVVDGIVARLQLALRRIGDRLAAEALARREQGVPSPWKPKT